jgi:hypothetical protein
MAHILGRAAEDRYDETVVWLQGMCPCLPHASAETMILDGFLGQPVMPPVAGQWAVNGSWSIEMYAAAWQFCGT